MTDTPRCAVESGRTWHVIGNLFKAWLASVVIRKVFPWLAVIALAVVALVWWVI